MLRLRLAASGGRRGEGKRPLVEGDMDRLLVPELALAKGRAAAAGVLSRDAAMFMCSARESIADDAPDRCEACKS